MTTLKRQILEVADGEPIIGVVIGELGGQENNPRSVAPELTNVVLPWERASELLDYEYDDGYGGLDCHAFYAWTDNYILFVQEYNGASSVVSAPRHPIACDPQTFGG